jgi:ribosome modulation factor
MAADDEPLFPSITVHIGEPGEPWRVENIEVEQPADDDDGFAGYDRAATARGNSPWTDDPAESARQNGWSAAALGAALTECPHAPASPEAKEWHAGWIDARHDQEIYSGRAARRTERMQAEARADAATMPERQVDPTEAILGSAMRRPRLTPKPDPTLILEAQGPYPAVAEAFENLRTAFGGIATQMQASVQGIASHLQSLYKKWNGTNPWPQRSSHLPPVYRVSHHVALWNDPLHQHIVTPPTYFRIAPLPKPYTAAIPPAHRWPADPPPMLVWSNPVPLRDRLPAHLLTDQGQGRGPQRPTRPTRRAPAGLRGVPWGHGTPTRRERRHRAPVASR